MADPLELRSEHEPAIVNWLTTERDVDLIVETVRELASVAA